MKLSKIFSKPIEIKGGGVLNLRGFRKLIIDKEIGEEGRGSGSGVIDKIIEGWYNKQMIPHSSKFYDQDSQNIINISDIDSNIEYYFLYKKSDYTEFSSKDDINRSFMIDTNNDRTNLYFANKSKGADIIYETTIDGEIYVALGDGKF